MPEGYSVSVPVDWTDFMPPDPELVIGKDRSLFRVRDLLELVRLLESIGGVRKGKGRGVK